MGLLVRLISGIQPVFDFMAALWYALPISVQVVFALFFAVAISLVMLRNFIL